MRSLNRVKRGTSRSRQSRTKHRLKRSMKVERIGCETEKNIIIPRNPYIFNLKYEDIC